MDAVKIYLLNTKRSGISREEMEEIAVAIALNVKLNSLEAVALTGIKPLWFYDTVEIRLVEDLPQE